MIDPELQALLPQEDLGKLRALEDLFGSAGWTAIKNDFAMELDVVEDGMLRVSNWEDYVFLAGRRTQLLAMKNLEAGYAKAFESTAIGEAELQDDAALDAELEFE